METEAGLWALRTRRPMSARFAFEGFDRSYSVGITALRLNCTLVSSLTYHDNGGTINKHVEAEGGTSPAGQDNGRKGLIPSERRNPRMARMRRGPRRRWRQPNPIRALKLEPAAQPS
jgi:hypothetical protein